MVEGKVKLFGEKCRISQPRQLICGCGGALGIRQAGGGEGARTMNAFDAKIYLNIRNENYFRLNIT